MPQVEPLSPTYAAARAAFLRAADAAGAGVASYPHPLVGLEHEDLTVDVAELGPRHATDVIVVISATHGVEGYCGSALQRHWLQHHAAERPDHVRVVMVHALNPYGMSWVRRVNEDNVDLNRNFPDWSQPVPQNAEYAAIADLVVPREWTDEEQQRTTGALIGLAAEKGFPWLQQVVSGGQYEHPTGVFYGGSGPTWSHHWLRTWTADHLGDAQRLAVIDLHTGLGPWGHGELIGCEQKGGPLFEQANALWFGEVTSMVDGDSVSAVVQGDWLASVQQLAPQAEIAAICIEYGTVDTVSVLQALRADAWLHGYGDPRGPEGPAVRAAVRAAFADDDPAWINTCWPRFHAVIGAALAR